ncbi:MAG: LysE family translocator [Firmicutes bacterium]|nr:LysE family translocator [Bacillota bacterium]
MILFQIFGQAFVVGFSGAMMPGSLLTYNIQLALKKGFWVGPKLVLGHAILEAVLILGLSLGLGQLLKLEVTQIIIGIAGGLMLAWMGYGLLRFESKAGNPLDTEAAAATFANGGNQSPVQLNPVFAGAVISFMNPYFLLWWSTIGLALISQAFVLGLEGIIFFYVGHILADLVWYSLISLAVSGGRRLITPKLYRWLLIGCGVLLIFFAVRFIFGALKLLDVPHMFFEKSLDLFKGFQKLV